MADKIHTRLSEKEKTQIETLFFNYNKNSISGIAKELNRSESTVSNYISNILDERFKNKQKP